MQSSGDPKAQNTSKGILVQLGLLNIHGEHPEEQEPKDERTEEERTPGNHQPSNDQNSVEEHPRDPPPSYQETMNVPHVMISYNWGHQEMVLKMRDKLKENGYNIWMDVDNMGMYFVCLFF